MIILQRTQRRHSIPFHSMLLFHSSCHPILLCTTRGTTDEAQPYLQRGIGAKLLVRHAMPACHILSPTTPPCSVVSLFHSSSIPFQFHFTLSIPATCLDPVRRVRGLGETVVRVPTLRSCVVIPQRTQCYQLHPVSLSLPLHVTMPALPHQLSCLLVYSHWSRTA